MFRFLFRNPHHFRTRVPEIHVHVVVLQNQYLRFITQISESTNTQSITLDYLINSCGLSRERALNVSKKIFLGSTEKPNLILKFFQNHGLTKTQITQLISKHPLILQSDLKTLESKIDFLNHLGVSGPYLAKLICSDPMLLMRSLKGQFIPSYDFLKSFLHTDNNVLTAFKRSTWVFRFNLEKVMGPNIAILRDQGVLESTISKLLTHHPRTLMRKTKEFNEIVDVVKQMGFDPSRPMFVHAVRTITGMNESNWERKLAVFREFGWTEEEIASLFRLQPMCMVASEEKIRRAVNFFMNKLKWKPAEISSHASVLMLSMEKRTVPRCAVLEVLNSEGVLKRNVNVGTVLKLSEKEFLEKFVLKYQESAPRVVRAYEGKIEFSGFGEVGGIT